VSSLEHELLLHRKPWVSRLIVVYQDEVGSWLAYSLHQKKDFKPVYINHHGYWNTVQEAQDAAIDGYLRCRKDLPT
jgi:hypothetical protein